MTPTYVPILKGKSGEFSALGNLSIESSEKIVPWIDVPRISDKNRQKLMSKAEPPVESFLNNVANGINKVWSNRPIFLDLPLWAANAQTESGEHVVPYLTNRLELLDVIVNPAVDYGRWEDPEYSNALQGIRFDHGRQFCIRLVMDPDTIDDMSDPDFFCDQLSDISQALGHHSPTLSILLDFNDISRQSYSVKQILTQAKLAISLVRNVGLTNILIAGCSLPSFVSDAVKAQNETGRVLRKEMIAWQTLSTEHSSQELIFADYGVRNPRSNDGDTPFPNANGKIRYTIDKEYFIARGYPLNIGHGYQQNHYLSQVIVNSLHYFGADFSWGDKRIQECSMGGAPGNQQTWISIDTNHHIEAVLAEVIQFRHQLAIARKKGVETAL